MPASRAEDLDSDGEDHVADEATLCMHGRVPVAYEPPKPPMWSQPLAVTTNNDGSVSLSHTARELLERRMKRAQELK